MMSCILSSCATVMSCAVEVEATHRRSAEISAAPLWLSPASNATITGPVLDPGSRCPLRTTRDTTTQANSDDMPLENRYPSVKMSPGGDFFHTDGEHHRRISHTNCAVNVTVVTTVQLLKGAATQITDNGDGQDSSLTSS